MKHLIFFGLLLFLISCKQKEKLQRVDLIYQTEFGKDSKKDFHPLIDMILSHIVRIEKERAIITLKVGSKVPYHLVEIDNYILKRLENEVPKALYYDFKHKIDQFELDSTKLSSKSLELLHRQDVRTNDTITYNFNGFLMSESEDHIMCSITVIYSDQISEGLGGGWHELVLFRKTKNEWQVIDRIETIEY